jgi:4'-phosphopantetheinyl transferase
MTIALSSREVHLWLASYGRAWDASLLSYYRTLLSSDEERQEARFYFAKDRLRYLVTRALVRTTLSRYVNVVPADWRFTANAYGRPQVLSAAAKDLRLEFNISHTTDLIVMAVSRDRAIGVDVESLAERSTSTAIARRCFAQQEVAALEALPAADQPLGFLEYWTLKEAYIKARGMGLSLPLDKFGFCLDDDRSISMWVHPELADTAVRWRLLQLSPPDHLVAVCVEQQPGVVSTLLVKDVIPAVYEQVIDLELSRVSR